MEMAELKKLTEDKRQAVHPRLSQCQLGRDSECVRKTPHGVETRSHSREAFLEPLPLARVSFCLRKIPQLGDVVTRRCGDGECSYRALMARLAAGHFSMSQVRPKQVWLPLAYAGNEMSPRMCTHRRTQRQPTEGHQRLFTVN